MSIKIPKPCAEKWSDIPPSERGRHCSACQTEVIDFTNWETDDIVRYIQNANKKICGRITPAPFPDRHFANWLSKCKNISESIFKICLSLGSTEYQSPLFV